jgi:FkbM family methyltransferase
MLLDADLWRIILRESGRARRQVGAVPASNIVEVDESSGLHLIAIGGHRYWVPRSMSLDEFSSIYSEVFCEDHPHYYEYGSCRIRPGDVVVDAGASEGLFTRFALERGARVIAVEPWRPMAEALRRTFAAEIAAGSVVVAQTCLSDEVGTTTLQIDPNVPWGGTIDPASESESAARHVSETVTQTTLDAFLASSPWGRCDFLKMDVEGIERKAVAGARETIARELPCLSIAVYHHATGYLDIRHDLRALGLRYKVTGKGLQRRGLYFPMILHAWPPARETA